MKNICFVLTAEFAVKSFLLNHLKALSKKYNVTVIVSTNNPMFLKELGVNARVIPLPIKRKVSIIDDLITCYKLSVSFRQARYDVVHTLMPKTGLLGGIASCLSGIPVRVHMFTGQVWANYSGLKRFLFKFIDRFIARLTTHNLVDGHSQRQFLIREKVLTQEKSIVFLRGSIAGVDFSRFSYDPESRNRIRHDLGILDKDIVFLFIGRLNRDKGVLDLAKAFNLLEAEGVHLIFVGPDEQGMREKICNVCKSDLRSLHFIDYTDVPEQYMSSSDVLCLPSYREGFNNVIIEAASVGVPSIASDIYGVKDAISHGDTGLLYETRNIMMLRKYMHSLSENADLRLALGEAAKKYVHMNYNSKDITGAWLLFYEKVLCE